MCLKSQISDKPPSNITKIQKGGGGVVERSGPGAEDKLIELLPNKKRREWKPFKGCEVTRLYS